MKNTKKQKPTSNTPSKKVTKAKKKKSNKKFTILAAIFLIIVYIVFFITQYVATVVNTLPKMDTRALKSDASSNIYAADGTLLLSSADNKRVYVKYEDIPQDYINLLISTEDRGFFSNRGVSIKGLTNAGLSYGKHLVKGTRARGGSTLEQQLIKYTVFSTKEEDRTGDRKIKEMFLAEQLYSNYSKEEILEFYVNKIFLGEGSYGIQTISQTYFNKNLDELTLSQLAIIAGLGQSPSQYNLYDNPKAVENRRYDVLNSTYENGMITKAQFDEALSRDVTDGLQPRYSKQSEVQTMTIKHDAFISGVLAQVADLGYDLEKTSLQIQTTLDIKMDDELKDIFDNQPEFFQDERQQAAATIIDPKTGYVLAQNGGRFTNEIHGFNRATSKGRSSGSAIKPIVDYGPAIEYLGWGTNYTLDSSPYTYPGTDIVATNFGGYSYGMQTMKKSLAMSYNTPAIRTLDAVGEDNATTFAKNLGITQEEPLAGSYALGVDASTEQLAAAYGAFANNGIYHTPQYITEITFSDGSTRKIENKGDQVMLPSTAYIITDMLKSVLTTNGTLPKGKIDGINQAAKTGTVAYSYEADVPNTAAMDIWTVGYTKSISIALWQGYDKPLEPNSYITEDFALGTAGKPNLYRELMSRFSKGLDNSDWEEPANIDKSNGLTPIETAKPIMLPNTTPELANEAIYKTYLDNELDFTKAKVTEPKLDHLKIPKDYKSGEWVKEYDKKRKEMEKKDEKDYELPSDLISASSSDVFNNDYNDYNDYNDTSSTSEGGRTHE